MVHPALLIHGADRLSPDRLATAGVHRLLAHVRIDHPKGGLNKRPSIVHFADDPVTMVPVICLDGFTRPAVRPEFSGAICYHIGVAVITAAGDDNAGLVAIQMI
jgi:hypothetical protein